MDGEEKYVEFQNEMEAMQRQFEKTGKVKTTSSSAWSSGWKKLSKLTKMSVPEKLRHHGVSIF
ncbi:hypothetical protein Bca52824_023500 [Brassica carinata]|uniref:Uncharacterized protein n=1 Tax=Brassica carinata TaxID=52824 RepID=A0A8X7VHX6_BRACI|nr:hypothetical protein Bca52824_023500 [Brassica carinata]